jgi:hypothetical protein
MKKNMQLYSINLLKERFGSELSINDAISFFYISERNSIFCYTGIKRNDERETYIDSFPVSLNMKNKTKMNDIFLRINKGCIIFDSFLNEDSYKDVKYKKLKCILQLPIGATTYFCVSDHIEEHGSLRFTENRLLTSEVFGMCYDELDGLLEAYSKIMHTNTQYNRYPRLTRSNKKDNLCDLTGLWIPMNFPYIAFEQSDYDFSHVSLWGFYRNVGLLCRSSVFYNALLSEGADKEALKNIIKPNVNWNYEKVMYKDIHKNK